jgi:LacI family transcriptional regulator
MAKRTTPPPPAGSDGEGKMAVNINVVAERAGVSIATVSRVLNGGAMVRPATRERVLEVARLLEYTPNATARSLSLRRTETLGAVLPALHGEFFSELLRGLDLGARRAGFHLLVSGSHSDRLEVEAVLRAFRGRVDALVLMFPDLDPVALAPHLGGLPAVLINCGLAAEGFKGKDFDRMVIDNYGGAAEVVRRLLELGHRRIAFLAGPSFNYDAGERRRGYLETLRLLAGDVEPLIFEGAFTEESGYQAVDALLALRERPTALFAANDAMAIGLLAALHERGLEVPRDLSLVGFDDIPAARYVRPALATVQVPIAQLGEQAMALALARVMGHGAGAPASLTLPVHFLERASCAPPLSSSTPGAGTLAS